MAKNKNEIQSTDVVNIDEANKQKNVGMKASDPDSHKNLSDIPDSTDTADFEDRKKKFASDEKKKRLGLLERIELRNKEKEENDILDTTILSKDAAEAMCRSNTAIRFEPNLDYGLNDEQIDQRIKEGLTNDNQKQYSKTYRQIFLNNIFTFFNVLCVIVAVALILVESYGDLSFLLIITLNTIIGIIQELKAKKTIDKLTIVTAPTATVIRQALIREIPVNELVLDDLIRFKNGKQISADCIIMDGNIEVNESLLTGESVAIKKGPGDKLYAGSFITAGNCVAKVDKVGKDCYIQKLQAKAKRYSKPKSELLRSLRLITTVIAFIIIPVGSIVGIRNYQSATNTVQDATFGSSGSLNVYGVSLNNNYYKLGSLNAVKSDPNTITIDTTDPLIFEQEYQINRIAITYDNKVNGNISISKIELNKYEVQEDGSIRPSLFESYEFNEENLESSLLGTNGLLSSSKEADRYEDGSIRLDATGDSIVTKQFDTISTRQLKVSVTLMSRSYNQNSPAEAAAMKKEIIRLTVTKTAGSMIGMIPAGMFLLVTIALAVSVLRLAKSKTLVQELYCIEMLARVDCICLDKTGTITDGTMKVKEIIDIAPPKLGEPDIDTIMGSLLGALNDNNQTSIALQDRFGVNFEFKKQVVLPFSSSRKLSAVTFEDEGTYILGAPEFVYQGKSKKINALIMKKASMGYRVLMLSKSDKPIVGEKIPQSSTPVAILVLEDHIREEAAETIRWFNENGVAVKVISGDNPATVAEIAGKVGIAHADDYISLEGLSPKEVETVATEYTVFGRVTPDQKAILVKTLKRAGKTVAMTGDGVNDILAMKEADCSIAMASGSEAARNVSHLVLLDSNFSNMPKVVLEGRRVINNIQRSSSLYLMKTLFTMGLTLLSIFATSLFTQGYPFVTKQFMLLEMFIIGVPSFVIALQPNKNKIHGSFLGNVISNCISQAFCLLLSVTTIYIIKAKNIPAIDLSNSEELSSLCVMALTYVGLVILVNVCRPLNTLRTILCIGMITIVTIAFSIPELASIFGISVVIKDINTTNLLFVMVVILAIIPIARFFSDMIVKVKHEQMIEDQSESK